jgi:hypothetical protein
VQNNRQGQRFTAFYTVSASLRQGIRPGYIASEIIDCVLEIPDNSMERVSGLLIAYQAELDKENFERAGKYLDLALDLHLYYPEIFRANLFLEGAYFEARIRNRVDIARQWFDKISDTTLIQPYSLLRAEAALLFLEGDTKAAQIKAEQGLVSTKRDRFYIGSATAENQWLQSLLSDIVKSSKIKEKGRRINFSC